MTSQVNGSSTGRANASTKRGTKKTTKSIRSGVLFPVARLHRYLKRLNPHLRVSMGASVYTAAVMEYLAAEVLELSGNAARDNNRTRITPRHIFLAVTIDEELKQVLKGVTISQGGAIPYIHPALLKKKKDSQGQSDIPQVEVPKQTVQPALNDSIAEVVDTPQIPTEPAKKVQRGGKGAKGGKSSAKK